MPSQMGKLDAPSILNSGPGFGFTGGQFGFNLSGPAGRSVVIEASSDLVNSLSLLKGS